MLATLPYALRQLALVHRGADKQLAAVETKDVALLVELRLERFDEVLQCRNSGQEFGLETSPFIGALTNDGTDLCIAGAIEKTIVMFDVVR